MKATKPDGRWQQPTGISPRPMLMGAPRNALRAFNAGVSLAERRSWPSVMPHTDANWLYRSPKVSFCVDHGAPFAGLCFIRVVIRLPMNFSRYSISALSGACDIWLWISRERLLSGDKNLSSRMHEWPVAEAWKGVHAPARAAMGFRLFCLP